MSATTYNTSFNGPADYFSSMQTSPESSTLENQLQRAISAIHNHLGMDVSFVSRLKDGRRLTNHADSMHPAGPIFIDEPLFAGSHITVPIRLTDGQVYGTFSCFFNSAEHSVSERDTSMLRVFAEIATEFIAADIEGRRLLTAIEARVHEVLTGNRLSMVYQPIHRLPDNRLVGYESLARFASTPDQAPDQWFSDAAQVGLDLQLEYRAIELALQSLRVLPHNLFIAVNASPKAIIDPGLRQLLQGWPVDRLVLEVTEHSIIDIYSQLAEAIEPLRAVGLRLAVDDTGAGYSSFRHILNLEPDIIKIDMSLTRNIHADAGRRALAAALVKFSMETGSVLIAEGVESAEELNVLRDLGIDFVQGYHLAHPMELTAAIEYSRGDYKPEF
jgi:EAL domain-containing protein (putative c-di-GMP-specific phosphodiesterase class I)